MSHIANVSTRRLRDILSYLREVSDLDQSLFKNRKDLCNFITEVQPTCEGSDSIVINKLINNTELVFGLMQQGVDSLIKIHRENNAFDIISEIKSTYQPFIKNAPFALQRLKTKLSTLENSPTKVADNSSVCSGPDSEKADSILYSKAWGETKTPVEANVTTDNPSLNSVPSPSHDVVSSDNTVTVAETSMSPSDPVALQCSVANLSPPSDAVVPSQAKTDQCESVDHANVQANFNTDVKNNKPGTISSDISLDDVINPPTAFLLKYSDAELDIIYALDPQQKIDVISEAQLICCDLLHNPDDTV